MTRPVLLAIVATTLVFAFAAARVVDLAWRMSPTYDEPKHLATGLTYVAQGWCCFGKDNTPMVGLNALPLYAMGVLPRLEDDERRLAATAPAQANPIRVRYFRARLANLVLLLVLLGGVAWWVGRGYGLPTGVLAAFCVSLEPNVIANAALVSPDFHVTATMTLALLALAALLDRGASLGRVIGAGVLIGCALLSKFNALVLIPGGVLVAAILPAVNSKQRAARVVAVVAACLVGGVCVALAYELPHRMGGLRGLGWWPFPDAALANALRQAVDPPVQDGIAYGFLGGLAEVRRIMEMGYPSYFHGAIAKTFALFYPALLLLKTPLPLLLLAPLGLWIGWRLKPLPAALPLLSVTALLSFASAMTSGLALGLRHILPIYPLLAIAAAIALTRARGAWPAKFALVLLLAFSGLRYHPHELAYFNELAGGPEQGHRYFADSNLDWGQDLFALRAALAKLNVPCEAYLHAPLPPAYLGLLPEVQGKKLSGWVAVSVTRKLGLWANMYHSDQALQQALANRQPVGRIGYSIWLYCLGD